MSDSDSTVLFGRPGKRVDRRKIRESASLLGREVAKGQAFTCYFTNDEELQRLNSRFLSHDYPTDVLSFPSPPDSGQLGELAISVERAAEQAVAHGHSVEQEIEILILHGLLHLMGMDHETDNGAMRRTETRWRKKLGFPTSLIERTARAGSLR